MNVNAFIRQRNRIERRFPQGGKRAKALGHLVREADAAVIIHEGRLSGWRLPCGSVVCSKRRFPTPEQARDGLDRIHADSIEARTPIRYYKCGGCGGFHLTYEMRR